MSFLDDLINPDSYSENVEPGLFGRIEILIWNSSLDEKQKARMDKRMKALTTNDGAWRMINELMLLQPVPGVHRTPMTLYEIVEATTKRADLDDFQETRNGKARV
jgi:hypothetical protein